MSSSVLVSVFCPDRSGLVAAITGTLFNLGANLAATTFTVLGSGSEFTAVAEIPDDIELQEIESHLTSLAELKGAKISVTRFDLDPIHGPSGRITHRIAVAGGDRPGLIARLCEVFVEHKANIVRLNAERIPTPNGDQYVVRFSVWIPETSSEVCLNTIANTAGELQLSCEWEQAKPPV